MIDNRYVQLEYLESSGTQYIDTGVVATSDIGVDFTFQLTSTSSNQRLGVIYDSSGYKRHHLDVGSAGLGYYFDGTVLGLTSVDTKKHHIVLDTVNKTLSFDGIEYSAKGYFTTPLNYWLFRRNSNRTDLLQYINLKLFGFKMYDKGILVRDFVPAKRKSDNVLGMFDKVNNVFYTNAGTGSFIGGKEIKNTFRSRIVPHAYNQISYLESTGKEYIDTGLKGNLNTELEGVFEITKFNSSGIANIAGDNTTSASAINFNFGSTSTQPTVRFGDKSNMGGNNGFALNTRYRTITNKTAITSYNMDGSVHKTVAFGTTTAFTTTNNMSIFQATNSTVISNARIFSFKIRESGVLVRDFIPVVRKIDNVAGMYDLVEGKFYTNAGTGSFKTGPEILTVDKVRIGKGISGYEFYDYIENTARQIIDTGILPKANQDYEVRFKLNTVGSNYAIFGGRDTQTNKTATLFFLTSGKYFRFDRTSQLTVSSGVVPNAGDVFKFECTNNVATLTNETTGQSATTTMTGSYNLDGNYPIHLFCVNTAGSDSLAFNGIIYEWKLKENGELVQHLVPAKRLSDNSIGMLDLVNREFHTNIGQGVFTTGSVVPAPVEPKEVNELRLPYNGNKYKFFDYIQSSGTQYIDVDLNPLVDNIRVSLDCEITSMTSGDYRGLMGTDYALQFAYTSAGKATVGNATSTDTVFEVGKRIIVAGKTDKKTISNTEFFVDGVDTGLHRANTRAEATFFCLFSCAKTRYFANMKCYGFQAWYSDTDVLVRDFIPAQRLSDNAIGMYDKVSGEFFGNKGTGVFIAGNEIVSIPNEYERLEYLESSGTEYIDTGIKAIANSKVEMRFNRTAYAGQASVSTIFGGYDSNQRNYGLAIDQTTIYWMFGGQSNAKKGFPLNTDYDVVFDGANKTFTIGDYTQSFSSLSLPAQSNGNIYLFTNSAVGSLATYNKQYWLKGKIYYFKYYENGTLVRNLFPVRRKADNVLGMLDTVNNVFYTNAGTGSFTTSTNTMPNKVMMPFWKRYPDVPSQYEVKEYLESDGYAQIDSGIRFTQGDKIDMVGRFIDPKHDDGLICMTPWNQGNNSRFMFAVAISGGTESFCMSYNTLAGGSNKVTPYFTPDTEYHRWTYEDLTLTIDDGVSSLTNTSEYPTTPTGTIYLFRRYNGACKTAIKYYNHWRNGQLIASYVPVRRKSDNVLGMYDRVSDKFLENVGTGSFTAG